MLTTYLTAALLTVACPAWASEIGLVRRQAPSSAPTASATTCTTTAVEPVPTGHHCGIGGTLAKPNLIKPSFTVPASSSAFITCRNDCLADTQCASFAFESGKNRCSLYGGRLQSQSIQNPLMMMNGIIYYDRQCFASSCGAASSCSGQQTKTVTKTVTTSGTATTSTSTSSAAPTGSPACTQLQNPSGTCANAANYNGGTASQLWGGSAPSLDACALLCAGEPGCGSLAYNPGATLSCVLFNTVARSLATTNDPASTTSFYDRSCFACTGTTPPLPATDDGCTPALQPPSTAMCDQSELFGGIPMFQLSPQGNTASSLGSCMQQCLATSSCVSITFDGSNCVLYSQGVFQLELNGVIFPVNPGVAGSSAAYDVGCLVCPKLLCTVSQAVSKRDLWRREVGLERREAELDRRALALRERERLLPLR